ncbi:hypothetical protein ISF_09433 [Cordyceps fumosorosea ARSEF 2679]|uniref:Uncharacterized protein n=1 Tax=Cordyceps fumosorosea (strain ARSEF 2679) TaxID=1081104 RepID=A0A167IM80_CORFA|nr:hypothetical protein ISF_09433 [Cordyceps fumosorosea ARSEF 2679]OAA49221.1 hypothetical protein ISF_09433 [Cordyceps fumosorosea ARSEF 2679]
MASPSATVSSTPSKIPSKAEARFYAIIDHFGGDQPPPNTKHDRAALVRCTYDHALTDEAKDTVLKAFFGPIAMPPGQPRRLDR